MVAWDIKTELFQLIQQADDMELLKAVKLILEKANGGEESTANAWTELPEHIRLDLEAALKEADRGDFIPQKQVADYIKTNLPEYEGYLAYEGVQKLFPNT